MKVVVAVDSFKGSLTSSEAGLAIKKGLLQVNPNLLVSVHEVADGGEGSLQVIKKRMTHLEEIKLCVFNTLHEKITTSYLITNWEGKKTAIIESAMVVGIEAINPSEHSTKLGSSYGLGEMILDAKNRGCQRVIVFLGGTATSDGGLGMLGAWSANASDYEAGNLLYENQLHFDLTKMQEEFSEIEILIGSDVTNPFSGMKGFAQVFAPQKGATPEQVQFLDKQAEKFMKQVQDKVKINLNAFEGSGAAGGIAGSLLILGGRIQSGFDMIAKMIDLEHEIQDADLIYTGEGRLDAQSVQGKLPMKICQLAGKYDVPVIALTGSRDQQLGALDDNLLGAFSIQQGPTPIEKALEKEVAEDNLEITARETFKLFQYNS
ncbi:glycerate kinase family protein [Isobaculum melis]|uniref:Glycerate kinase n=1 Tax=Isobaculum melis TaxID=142588 RepID=A0A1H9Q3Y8_9LACT|nr:glycerate kinase [Isobaculum melis]SER55128.1 glycerate kinase [Isobaculum melis]